MESILATGIIRTSHGVKGFLKVKSFADDHSNFLKLKKVHLFRKGNGNKEAIDCDKEIESVRFNGNDILIKFSGIDSPEEARNYNGAEIMVEREFCAPLKNGEVYISDLVGLDIVYENEKVARVTSVYEGLQAPLMECKKKDGTTCIIPFMEPFTKRPDLKSNTLELCTKDILS